MKLFDGVWMLKSEMLSMVNVHDWNGHGHGEWPQTGLEDFFWNILYITLDFFFFITLRIDNIDFELETVSDG